MLDKAIILVKDKVLCQDSGFSSIREAKQTIKELEPLRNNLGHSQDIITNS